MEVKDIKISLKKRNKGDVRNFPNTHKKNLFQEILEKN